MGDKVEPGEAGKAQAIWGAAFPERAPLASQATGELGHKLGWRVTRFEDNQAMTQESANRKSRKKEEMGRLQDVERAARALDALLDEDHPAISRLMRSYHDKPFLEADLPGLLMMKHGLARMSQAAKAAADYRRDVNPMPLPKGVSPLDLFILALARDYESYSSGKPAIKLAEGKKAGSFVAFVQETARQFGVRVPAGETNSEGAWEEGKSRCRRAMRHGIDLVK
jgi:hypothetical protein